MITLIELLDSITELEAQVDLTRSKLAEKMAYVIPDTVAMELEALKAEYVAPLKEGQRRIDIAEKQAQLMAAQGGVTVKGQYRQAVVYEKVTWNDEGLRRFLADALPPEKIAFALQHRNVKVVAQIRQVK